MHLLNTQAKKEGLVPKMVVYSKCNIVRSVKKGCSFGVEHAQAYFDEDILLLEELKRLVFFSIHLPCRIRG